MKNKKKNSKKEKKKFQKKKSHIRFTKKPTQKSRDSKKILLQNLD